MNRNVLINYVIDSNFAELLNLSKDCLEQQFGEKFAIMKNFEQNNPHHCYDLLEHTVRTAENVDCSGLNEIKTSELKIAALFHDIGKPAVAFEKNGRTVFYNHAEKSREFAENELRKYDLQGCSEDIILFYISHHDDFISFKLKSEVKNNINPYISIINLKSVSKKITEVQRKCRENGIFVPSTDDYILLMRLCVADAQAQSLTAIQNGTVIDSRERKVARLKAIEGHIKEIKNRQAQDANI